MIKIKIIFLGYLIILTSCKKEEFKIIGTIENFTINSTIVNDDYKINIYLPPNYPQANIEYPLVISTDGDMFEYLASIVSQLIKNKDIPPTIFAGIGYGENPDRRNRDYTPTKMQDIGDDTGGALNFYNFIRTELIPELENKYQLDTANTKTLVGHSYGGLFTLFAMFQKRETNPFDKFIPIASSFWYDSGIIFEYEENYSQSNSDFPIKVYTAMGSLEGTVMVASFKEMNERIINRNYPNLVYKNEILKKYGHSSSAPISYKNGLKYVFNN